MDWIPEIVGVVGGGVLVGLRYVSRLRRLYREMREVYDKAVSMQAYYRQAKSDGTWTEEEFTRMGQMAGELVSELADVKEAARKIF